MGRKLLIDSALTHARATGVTAASTAAGWPKLPMWRIHFGRVAIAAGASTRLPAHSRTPRSRGVSEQVMHCAVGVFGGAQPFAHVGEVLADLVA